MFYTLNKPHCTLEHKLSAKNRKLRQGQMAEWDSNMEIKTMRAVNRSKNYISDNKIGKLEESMGKLEKGFNVRVSTREGHGTSKLT